MHKGWDAFRKRLSDALAPHGAVSEFSRKSGISRATLDKWLDDKNPTAPSLEFLDKAAAGLGVEPWELLKPLGPHAPREAPDARLALFGAIVSRLAALNEPQLRFLLPYVDSAIEIQGAGQRQELRDKNRKL